MGFDQVSEIQDPLFGKPFVLSIGPQKCGAEWIDNYLRQRGDVCLPEDVKEVFYFDRHYQRGPAFYISHFNPQDHHRLVMEVSTTAFDAPQAPEHVFALFGHDVQLLCPLRHPVQRAIRVYQDYLKYGIVQGSFEEAVAQAPQILHASRYSEHLKHWIDQFGAGAIKFVFAQDIETQPAAFAQNLCKYLSLPYEPPKNEPAHPDETLPALDKNDLAWVQNQLGEEIEKVQNLCGFTVRQWEPPDA